MKKLILLLTAVLLMASLAACSGSVSNQETAGGEPAANPEKLSVVCTIYPQYDFIRQIAGDDVKLTMLLAPGSESHTFEPTPQDIVTINDRDLFVYVGGDSDAWVEEILESADSSKMTTVKLMDCVNLVEEETIEGMTPEQEEGEETEEIEYDEHVWTSVRNSEKIVQRLCDVLCQLDAGHAQDYEANTQRYLGELDALDKAFQDVVDNAARKEIVVGDRFPFRYFCEDYGLKYYAAFPGCSTDTEASASTIAFLVDKVRGDGIPVVFHIELSNEQVCNSICEMTGAKGELLNAAHNISKDGFEAGVTYLDLMKHNVEVLKEALN